MYAYVKAVHIIFIVTWFAGMFYMPRLFIYNREAQDKPEPDKQILSAQFKIMMRRLWYGITWPSAVITAIMGGWIAWLYGSIPEWLAIKLAFVCGLYAYHFTLHKIFIQQQKGIFKYSTQQLRLWNEIATLFLVAIVMIVSVKQALSALWGIVGLASLVIVLMLAIRIYKKIREPRNQ